MVEDRIPSLWFFVSWPLSLRSNQVADLRTATHEWEKDYEHAVETLSKATRERLDEVGLLDMTFVSEVAAEGWRSWRRSSRLGIVDDAANDWAAFFEVTEVARRSVAKRRRLHVLLLHFLFVFGSMVRRRVLWRGRR